MMAPKSRNSPFRVAHINVRSLHPRLEELGFLAQEHSLDVLAVQETWLKPGQKVSVPGFFWIGDCRSQGKGGGTGFLVSNKVVVRRRADLARRGLEATWIEVLRSGGSSDCVLVGSVYIPPRRLDCLRVLEGVVSGLDSRSSIMVLGDFNAYSTAWGAHTTNSAGRVLEEVLVSGRLCVVNDPSCETIWSPSRRGKPHFPDLTLVSSAVRSTVLDWRVCDDVGSDHLPVMMECGVCVRQYGKVMRSVWDFESADWDLYRECLDRELGEWLRSQGSVSFESSLSLWYGIVRRCCERAVPRKKVSVGARFWWSREVGELVRERRRLRRAWQRSGSDLVRSEYRRVHCLVKQAIRDQKERCWKRLTDSLNSEGVAMSSLHNLYRRSQEKPSYRPTSLDTDNGVAVSSLERAEAINSFFSSVGSEHLEPHSGVEAGGDEGRGDDDDDDGDDYKEGPCVDSNARWQDLVQRKFDSMISFVGSDCALFVNDFSFDEVHTVVKRIKPRKAPGPDGIYPSLILNGGVNMSRSLCVIFNRSWQTGCYPRQWREANICPIPKVDHPSRADQFRPISLLSVIGKLMESIIQSRLSSYVEENDYLPVYQSGFRPGHGTLDQIVVVQQEIHGAFARNESLVFVKLDMQKAYDRVWRAGIMERLRCIGVGGRMYSWIRAFLRDRRARVVLEGVFSSWSGYGSGVPQGSPLSPLLFNIFATPLLRRVIVPKVMYADDVGLLCSGDDVRSISDRLTVALHHVWRWERRYKALFRLDKCYCVLFTQRRLQCEPSVYFKGKCLKVENSLDYLGVSFDRGLRWTIHISELRTKAIKRLETLLRICREFSGARHDRVILLYKVCVRPIFDYACQVWNDAAVASKRTVDSLQHRILARALGVRRGTSVLAVQVATGVEPLAERRHYLTAKAYSRFLASDSRVGRLVRDHRDGRITVGSSSRHCSFSRCGESLVNGGKYPAVGDRKDFRQALLRNWQQQWDSSVAGRGFFAIQSKVSFGTEGWTDGFPRWAVTVLAGMRLGSSVLNVHLYREGLVPSELCECGVPETVEHFWLYCPRYVLIRTRIVAVFCRILSHNVIPTVNVFLDFMSLTKFKAKRKELRSALLKFLSDSKRFAI